MKIIEANNSRYGIIINCGQLASINRTSLQDLLDCPDRELVCSISKDAAGIIHFTGSSRKKLQRHHDSVAEWGILV